MIYIFRVRRDPAAVDLKERKSVQKAKVTRGCAVSDAALFRGAECRNGAGLGAAGSLCGRAWPCGTI